MDTTTFREWASRHGYTEDTYGHFQKSKSNGKKYRMKVQSKSIRYEVQVTYHDNSRGWVRLASAYFSQLSLNDKDQLVGLKSRR